MTKKTSQPTEKHVLAHPKHTGRRLENRHTSYPVLLFMLLVLGVFLLGITAHAKADNTSNNVLVTARVAGNPPPAARITSPADNGKAESYVIPVSGTCDHATIVELYRNNILSGTALCSANDTFTISTSLFCGQNSLYTKIFNLGDTEGPDSPPSIVSLYEPTQTITTVTTPTLNGSHDEDTLSGDSQGCALTQAPMLLQSLVSYQLITVGQTLKWTLNIGGGTGPYAINVDWGDGSTSILSESSQGNFQISHVYEKTGGYHGDYQIKVTVVDALGDESFIQIFALVNSNSSTAVGVTNPSNNGGAAGSLGSSFSSGPSSGVLHTAWSIYGLAFLMTLSYWLGERRGFELWGKHRAKSKTKHAH